MTAPGGTGAREFFVEPAVPYGHGQVLDIYTPRPAVPSGVVLLWHGIGADRAVLEPLARATAALGVTVFVPDWDSGAPDGGRAQLLGSLSFTRQRCTASPGRPSAPGDPADLGDPADPGIVLAGWSRGGKAAAGLAVNPRAVDGWRPRAVVCLGAGFRTPAPTTGSLVLADLAQTSVAPVPFWLVHGSKDKVVDPSQSRGFAALLTERGWPVRLDEPPADHSGVVMAEYDPVARRSRPTANRDAIEAGQLAARILRSAAAG